MLSDNDLKKAIEQDEIAIAPFTPQHLRPSGIVFHLGPTLLKAEPDQVVDVNSGEAPSYSEVEISMENPYLLKSGEFLLGETFEKVSLSPSYSLMIEGRSTLARLGLTIVQTATLVYPGHTARRVTLELANHGPHTIKLYPAMKIARGMFFKLSSPASYSYDEAGKYQDQKGVGQPIFRNEINKDILDLA